MVKSNNLVETKKHPTRRKRKETDRDKTTDQQNLGLEIPYSGVLRRDLGAQIRLLYLDLIASKLIVS